MFRYDILLETVYNSSEDFYKSGLRRGLKLCDFNEYNDETISFCSVELILSQDKEFTEADIVQEINAHIGKPEASNAPTEIIVKSAIDVLLDRSKIARTPFAYVVV